MVLEAQPSRPAPKTGGGKRKPLGRENLDRTGPGRGKMKKRRQMCAMRLLSPANLKNVHDGYGAEAKTPRSTKSKRRGKRKRHATLGNTRTKRNSHRTRSQKAERLHERNMYPADKLHRKNRPGTSPAHTWSQTEKGQNKYGALKEQQRKEGNKKQEIVRGPQRAEGG